MLSRADASDCEVLSKAFSALSFAVSNCDSASSPASRTASVAASATCSVKAAVICRSSWDAPTSVIFGAIALAFSLT